MHNTVRMAGFELSGASYVYDAQGYTKHVTDYYYICHLLCLENQDI